MSVTPEAVAKKLPRWAEKMPEAIVGEEDGVWIVKPDALRAVAKYLKEEKGYDYLANVAGVDNLLHPNRKEAERFEVVYHFYSTERGGDYIAIKARANADDPVLPSLVSIFPTADFQEREIWDLYGIKFTGHPNLRRILLWDGFFGHPMRKDYREAYYEEEHRPYGSRYPEGQYVFQEDRTPWKNNLVFPGGFDPEHWHAPEIYYEVGQDFKGLENLNTDRIVVNIGPQHPSTHGVLRMIVGLEGETVTGLELELGYLHRNHEKIGERNTYLMNIPFTDRLDYITSMTNNFGYVLAVEKLMPKAIVPERAEYLRVIMAELTRAMNHLFAIGFLLNDMGAFYTPSLYAIEERELILDLFEMASGSRMMCNYMRFGGVAHDVGEEWVKLATELVHNRLPRAIDEMEALLTTNEILLARTKNVGYLSPEDAIAYGTSGPVLRGSGVPYDIRKVDPYSIYDRFDFDLVTEEGGDVYARYMMRIREARESVRILKQALRDLPGGPIMGKPLPYMVKIPANEAYTHVEAPKGELGFYIVSDGTPNPYRYHVRAPSFINLNALATMAVGHKIADAIIILGSIDIVLGEVDR